MRNINSKIVASVLVASMFLTQFAVVFASPYVDADNSYFYEDFNAAASFNVIKNLGDSSASGNALATYMKRNNHDINHTLIWSGTAEDGYMGVKGRSEAQYNNMLVDMSGSNTTNGKTNEYLKGFWYDLDTYLGTFVVTQDVKVPTAGRVATYLVREEADAAFDPSIAKMINLPEIRTNGETVTASVVTGARNGAWGDNSKTVTKELSGVTPGDWIQIGIVLTRTLSDGETISSDYSNVIYNYSMVINGELVEDTNGNTQWTINPKCSGGADYSWAEYRIKNGNTTKEKFKGIGVASDLKPLSGNAWSTIVDAETGIDNILFRQYNGTEADIENDVTYSPSESGTVDEVTINFTNSSITDESAPDATKKGMIDYGSIVVTKYAADGVTTTVLDNDEIIDYTCSEKDGNNGKLSPDGSKLKLTNLGIDGGEYVVISLEDITRNIISSFKVSTTEEAPEIPTPPTPSEPEEPVINDNLYLYEDFSNWDGSTMSFGGEFSASKGARVPYLFPDNSDTMNQKISWHGTSNDGYMAAKGNPDAKWNNKVFSMSNDGGKTVNRGFKSDWLDFLGTIVITEDIKTPQVGSSNSVLGSVFSTKANSYNSLQNYIIEYATLSFNKDKKLQMVTGFGDFAGGMWQNWITVNLAEKGITPGDWYQAGVVLTRYTTDGEAIAQDFSNVRYRYSLLVNGTPIARNGISSWVIDPLSSYESNGKTIYPCPEGMIVNGIYKRSEFLGLGITSYVAANDGLEMGFDNINMRVYENTSIPKMMSVSAETQVVDIPVRNTAMPTTVSDKIACGIADINYGNNYTVTAVKYDAEDTFMANGIDITSSVKLVNNEDKYRNTLWDIKTNDVDNSESYMLPNGSVLRMTGIDLEPNERIVVTFNGLKDILGNDLVDNQIILYSEESTDLDIVKIQFSDVNDDLLSVTKTNNNTETIVSASATKIHFYVDDDENKEITLKSADGTFSETAVLSNGIYIIDLQDSCLKANTLYKIYCENEEKGEFKTDSGDWTVHSVKNDGTNTSIIYTNSLGVDKDVFVVYSGSDETGAPTDSGCFVQKLELGKNGNVSKNTPTGATNNTAFVLEKLYNGSANTNITVMSAEDVNSDNEFTVKGILPGYEEFPIVVYKSGNAWKDENNEVAAAQLLYAQKVATLEDGSYSVKFRFKNGVDTSGEYTIAAYTNNGVFVDTVSYSDSIENAQALLLLNSATEKDVAWGIMNAYRDELSFGYAYYDNLTEIQQKDVAQMLIDYKQKSGNFDKNTAIDAFRQGVMAVSFNNGLPVSIKDFERSVSYLSSGVINKWLNKTGYVIDVQANWIPNIDSRLRNKQIGSIEEFKKALIASLVFTVIDTPVSVTVLTEMFSDFAGSDYISLDSNLLTNKVINKVYSSDKSYSGFEFTSLKTDMQAYKNANVSPEGGGGSSGGGLSSKPTIPVVIGQETAAEPIVSSVYTDLNGFDWAKTAIEELTELGVISGKGNGKFAPYDNVKREEFVKMIVCLLGVEVIEGKTSFADVDENGWYNNYIKAAVDNNIVNGREDGSFGIGDNISRQDICKIIHNVLQLKGIVPETSATHFSDYSDVSDYAKQAVETLSTLNIVNGYEDSTFRPHSFATRAEAAKIVYAIATLIK